MSRYDLAECTAHNPHLSDLDRRLLMTLGAIWRSRNAHERRAHQQTDWVLDQVRAVGVVS